MNPMQRQVVAFHQKFGRPVNMSPSFSNTELRAKLIKEEFEETMAAMADKNLVETIDGFCDLIYVILGAAIEFGVDLEPIFNEVHRTNMLKEGGPTRSDGKILKPEGWQKPKIAELLEAQKDRLSKVIDGQQ